MTTAQMGPILLIEDDRQHAKIIRRTLQENQVGNPLIWLDDGEKALEYLSNQDQWGDQGAPTVILLDLKLPKLDGHEVLAKIKEDPELRLIPVVVLTTSDAELDRVKAYEHRANSYLVKPMDFDRFRDMVRDLCLYWGVWNRAPVAP